MSFFGEEESESDAVLNDIMLKVENDISNYFEVVNSKQALNYIDDKVLVISPKINVETQYWDGGHTYITITFYDFATK